MITDEKLLPVIHYNAALTLLEMEADLVVTTSIMAAMEMTSLQKRCVKELALHWREVSDMDAGHVTKVCRKLPCGVVTDLMLRSMSIANKKTDSIDASTLDENGKLRKGKKSLDPVKIRKEYEAKLEQVKHQCQEQMDKLKKEAEMKMYRCRQMLAEKDKQLQMQRNELISFERLPNSYDGKLAPTGRKDSPTMLPAACSKEHEDGMLLIQKKTGLKFPLYYYKRAEQTDHSNTSTKSGTSHRPPQSPRDGLTVHGTPLPEVSSSTGTASTASAAST
jgi:hypothetical protein